MDVALKEVFNVHRNVVRGLRQQLQQVSRERDQLKQRIDRKLKQLQGDASKLREEAWFLQDTIEKHNKNAETHSCCSNRQSVSENARTCHGTVQALEQGLVSLERALSVIEEHCQERFDKKKPNNRTGQGENQLTEQQPREHGNMELDDQGPGQHQDNKIIDHPSSDQTSSTTHKEGQQSGNVAARLLTNLHRSGQTVDRQKEKQELSVKDRIVEETSASEQNNNRQQGNRQLSEQTSCEEGPVRNKVTLTEQETRKQHLTQVCEGSSHSVAASSGKVNRTDSEGFVIQQDGSVTTNSKTSKKSPPTGTRLQLVRSSAKRRRYTEDESTRKAKRQHADSNGQRPKKLEKKSHSYAGSSSSGAGDMTQPLPVCSSALGQLGKNDERGGCNTTMKSVSTLNSFGRGSEHMGGIHTVDGAHQEASHNKVQTENHNSGNTVVNTKENPIILVPETQGLDLTISPEEVEAESRAVQSPGSSVTVVDNRPGTSKTSTTQVLSSNPSNCRLNCNSNTEMLTGHLCKTTDNTVLQQFGKTSPKETKSKPQFDKTSPNKIKENRPQFDKTSPKETKNKRQFDKTSPKERKDSKSKAGTDHPDGGVLKNAAVTWPTDSVLFGSTLPKNVSYSRQRSEESSSVHIEEGPASSDLQSPVFITHLGDGGDQSPALFEEVDYEVDHDRTSCHGLPSPAPVMSQTLRPDTAQQPMAVSPTSPLLLKPVPRTADRPLTVKESSHDDSPELCDSPRSPSVLGMVETTDTADVPHSSAFKPAGCHNNITAQQTPVVHGKAAAGDLSSKEPTTKPVQRRSLFRSKAASASSSADHFISIDLTGQDVDEEGANKGVRSGSQVASRNQSASCSQLNASLDPAVTLTQYLKDAKEGEEEDDVQFVEEECEGADSQDVTLNPNFQRAHQMSGQDITLLSLSSCDTRAATQQDPAPPHTAANSNTADMASLYDSFDRVPRKKDQPNYAFAEVVRKQGERRKLKAFSCQECEKYYKSMGLSDAEKRARMQQCSRHRARQAPPHTPEHFWSVGFPDSPDSPS